MSGVTDVKSKCSHAPHAGRSVLSPDHFRWTVPHSPDCRGSCTPRTVISGQCSVARRTRHTSHLSVCLVCQVKDTTCQLPFALTVAGSSMLRGELQNSYSSAVDSAQPQCSDLQRLVLELQWVSRADVPK
eukprot:6201704-Pleurochrysis_carterae.AAC.1